MTAPSLDGRVVVVTGASRGIGAAIARRFAAEGARVVAVARTLDDTSPSPYPGTLADTIASIVADGHEAVAVRADLASPPDRQRLVEEAHAAYGGVDILVNNAAASWARPFADFPAKQFDIMFGVHVRASFELAQQFLPDMVAAGRGWILNMTSGAARPPVGPPFDPMDPAGSVLVYSMCKAALERFTLGLAAEVYASNIAVNALAPSGPVLTHGMNHPPVPEGLEDTVERAEDTAEAALFLCTGDPRHVTGRVTATLPVLQELGEVETMDLELSADQELFVETTRRFLETEAPLTRVRELHGLGGGLDPGYWRQGVELGWTAMLVPASLGGGSISAHGLLDLALVAEEMGRVVAPGPLLPVNVVLDTLCRSGSPEQRAAVVPALLGGEAMATWAYGEGRGRWDPAGVQLQAKQDGTEWVLDGTKTFVQEAVAADWLLVTARTGDGLTQFLVARTTDGVMASPRTSLDLVRPFGDVSFSGARLPASAVVGAVGGAADDVERQLQVALVLQNAETVGAIDRVFSFTLEYANDRVAFGRPIASYQALKHRFADMKMWLEACHATSAASAHAVATDAANRGELVSVAASYIADRAPLMVQDCVQIHGGIGVTWEHDLHLYLRRVTQNAMVFGGVRQHRERVAALLGL